MHTDDAPNYKNYESMVKIGLSLSKRLLELKAQFQDSKYVPDQKDFEALLTIQRTQRENERSNMAKFDEIMSRALKAEEKCNEIMQQNHQLHQILQSHSIEVGDCAAKA